MGKHATVEGTDRTETIALRAHAERLTVQLEAARRDVQYASGADTRREAMRRENEIESDLADTEKRLVKRAAAGAEVRS